MLKLSARQCIIAVPLRIIASNMWKILPQIVSVNFRDILDFRSLIFKNLDFSFNLGYPESRNLKIQDLK